MRKIGWIIFFVLIISSKSVYAERKTSEQWIIDDYLKVYGEPLENGFKNAAGEVLNVLPGFSAEDMLLDAAQGKNIFHPKEILSGVLRLFVREIRNTMKILVFIPALAILCLFTSNMQDGFKSKGISSGAFYVCYVIMAGILAAAFLNVVSCGKSVIQNISMFMRVLLPVVLASLAAGGAVISATTYEFVLIWIVEITQWAVEFLFMPMVMIAAALGMVNNLSSGLSVEKLTQFINKTVKWGLGIMLTMFVGITGFQGIVSGSADGLSVKITRFAASNLIPMVGGILSETVETVMNCSVVIKNSLGVLGIVMVVLVAVIPILKIAACLVLFRLCTALIQPISEERMVKCMTDLSDSVSSVFSMSVAVVIMFIIILTVIINLGNSALLLGR